MYHFETNDSKNKKVIFENKDLKLLLPVILNYSNGLKNDDELSIVFEDSVGSVLLDIPEKYIKHSLEITKIRKTPKLEKSIADFNKLNLKLVSSITFKNKCHEGTVTIWDEEQIEAESQSEDEAESQSEENDSVLDNDHQSDSGNEGFIADNSSESSLESVHMSIDSTHIQIENKKLRTENKKLKEQIELLKSFVKTYRDMCLKLSDESKKVLNA
jgi:hypothetical protein